MAEDTPSGCRLVPVEANFPDGKIRRSAVPERPPLGWPHPFSYDPYIHVLQARLHAQAPLFARYHAGSLPVAGCRHHPT